MYFKLKKGFLRGILDKCFAKAGNIRILEKQIGISRTSLSCYHMEKRLILEENLNKLLDYLGISIDEKEIIEKFPSNWGQINGGKRCVEIKRKKGTFEKQLKQCHKQSSKYMKKWHKKMKDEKPREYYLMQYEKFKKIGGYNFRTLNDEKVRNKFEKDVADLLKDLGINYKYEPLIHIGKKYFFPDFLIDDKIILECTEWRGVDKAIKLRDKIKILKKNYKVYVVIPKPLKRYYETINQYLLLGLDDLKQILDKSW